MICLRYTQQRAPFRSCGSLLGLSPALFARVDPFFDRRAVVAAVFVTTASAPGVPMDMLTVERDAASSSAKICVRGVDMPVAATFSACDAPPVLGGVLLFLGVTSGDGGPGGGANTAAATPAAGRGFLLAGACFVLAPPVLFWTDDVAGGLSGVFPVFRVESSPSGSGTAGAGAPTAGTSAWTWFGMIEMQWKIWEVQRQLGGWRLRGYSMYNTKTRTT